jgi:GNAT superfamily N-acetyltransferase
LPPDRALRRGTAVIRPGRDDDATDIIEIVSACWSEYPGCVTDIDGEAPELRALASYCAKRDGAVWVAEADAKIVGVACTYPLPDGAWEIAKIYVARAHRGGGVAHELVETAENFARAHGATRMKLWSDTRFDRAHRFYEKRGYVRAGPIRALADKSSSIEFAYAKPLTGVVVEQLDAAAAASAEYALARVLVACVEGGASVAFMAPLPLARARAFWRDVARGVARGERLLVVAWLNGTLLGTVQLDLAVSETQPHRAEVQKLLVHPDARQRGLGRMLLAAAERAAAERGRSMLLLDVSAGDAAEALYRAAGWTEVGRVPDYARKPDGSFCDTLFFFKRVG